MVAKNILIIAILALYSCTERHEIHAQSNYQTNFRLSVLDSFPDLVDRICFKDEKPYYYILRHDTLKTIATEGYFEGRKLYMPTFKIKMHDREGVLHQFEEGEFVIYNDLNFIYTRVADFKKIRSTIKKYLLQDNYVRYLDELGNLGIENSFEPVQLSNGVFWIYKNGGESPGTYIKIYDNEFKKKIEVDIESGFDNLSIKRFSDTAISFLYHDTQDSVYILSCIDLHTLNINTHKFTNIEDKYYLNQEPGNGECLIYAPSYKNSPIILYDPLRNVETNSLLEDGFINSTPIYERQKKYFLLPVTGSMNDKILSVSRIGQNLHLEDITNTVNNINYGGNKEKSKINIKFTNGYLFVQNELGGKKSDQHLTLLRYGDTPLIQFNHTSAIDLSNFLVNGDSVYLIHKNIIYYGKK